MNPSQLIRALETLDLDSKLNTPTCTECGHQQLADGDPIKFVCPSCGNDAWDLKEEAE